MGSVYFNSIYNVSGHRKLLSEYTIVGNAQMVRYLLSLPGICDPKMEDGTTAFVMSLSRKDVELIEVLLRSEIKSEVDPKELARRAVFEMNRVPNEENAEVKEVLTNTLKYLKVYMNENVPPEKGLISEE